MRYLKDLDIKIVEKIGMSHIDLTGSKKLHYNTEVQIITEDSNSGFEGGIISYWTKARFF